MLSLETQNRAATFFLRVANLEKTIENQRVKLVEQITFEPRSAFKRIDRNRNFSISNYELQDFLRENGIYTTSAECSLVIAAYDCDKDGKLDYREFEKLVLPNDHTLKMRAYGRNEPYIGYKDKLALEVEFEMSYLVKMEIDKLKDLQIDKKMLKSRYDFSQYDLFKIIDAYRVNNILREDLRNFINKNGEYASSLDVENIMRRIDLDQDGRITYVELSDYLSQGEEQSSNTQSSPLAKSQANYQSSPNSRVPSSSPNKMSSLRQTLESSQDRYSKTEAKANNEGIDQKNCSPLRQQRAQTPNKYGKGFNSTAKKSQGIESLDTQISPEKNYQTPQKELKVRDLDNNNYSAKQGQDKEEQKASSSTQKQTGQTLIQRETKFETVNILKNIIQSDNEVEKLKQELALKSDFNLYDAFRLFDKYNMGHLYKNDFEDALNRIGVFAPRSQINLIFKKLDRDGDGKIRFSEFSESISPIDKIYREHLDNKRPNYDAKSTEEAISYSTKLYIGDVFRKMAKNEAFIDDLRHRINRNCLFSYNEAFNQVDANQNGFLAKDELSKYLDSANIIATNKELDILIDRFDRDRDGKVTYGEFFAEISPKEN